MDSNEPGCNADGRSRSTPMLDGCSNDTGPTSGDGMTCEPSRLPTETVASISSAAGFPARTSVSPTLAAMESTGLAPDSGEISPGSFAIFVRDTSSWRTSQRCLFGGWTGYSQTWPRSGSMRNGRLFRRAPWVPHTHGKDCSLWPTLLVSDSIGSHPGTHERTVRSEVKRIWGRGPLNPDFAEWLMGFPIGHTAFAGSATLSFPRSPSGSDDESSKPKECDQ